MATNQLRGVLQTLRRATLHQDEAARTDGQLLECYVKSREEAAFADLVQRHGPMVWGVCRRVLHSDHDAEDAFQATFLVLVRKAASVVPRELVANWLYGVAHQTALKARATTAKRRLREKQVTVMPEPTFEQQKHLDDLQLRLDRELSRLPDKYRALIVLCDLEGKTRKEAARHFHLPEGTVASRLATARTMLTRRLARTGLAVSGGVLAAVLSQKAASASMPPSVASNTIKAASLFAAGQGAAGGAISVKAAALAEGVLKTMLLNKLKFATAVLIVGALAFGMTGFGVRLFLHSSVEAAQARVQKEAPKTPAGKEADKPKTDQELIQGTWVFVGLTVGGKKEWNENAPPKSLTFADDKVRSLVVNGDGKEAAFQSRFKLDASRKPKELDMTDLDGERKGKTTACVYEIDGDTLRLCHAARPGGDRPAALESKEGSTDYLWTLKRADKEKLKPATEKKEAEAKPQAVSGVVKTVDLEKNTLTVARIEGESAFSLAKDARIEIDGKAGRLAGLPAGANVTLTDFVDARTARSIQAGGRWYFGAPVVSVDATKNTITVDDKEGQKTFAVAQDACITVDGKGVKLAEVPRGAHLNLGLAADQTTARFIGADGPYLGGCGGSCVKAVDTINNTITFDDKALPEVAGKTFAVSKDAGITIDGNPGKLADVPVGCYVNVGLSVDQSTVLRVSAQGPSNLCDCGGSPVKAVDATLNTITFDDKARAEVAGKTFPISKGANIVIDGKPGKLTDVPSGAYVSLRLSVDRQTAIHVHAQGPGGICDCGGSLVTAVDAEKHTITFDDKCRAEVAGKTFAVAKDALIAIDGKPGKLADLPAGAYVDLNLRVDRQTVGQINAQGPAVTGVLSAVDAEKNALTVADRTFNVAKDAVIVIDGKRGQLSGLATGVNVSLRLHVDQKTVGEIRVDAR